jgi:hypothetical protein
LCTCERGKSGSPEKILAADFSRVEGQTICMNPLGRISYCRPFSDTTQMHRKLITATTIATARRLGIPSDLLENQRHKSFDAPGNSPSCHSVSDNARDYRGCSIDDLLNFSNSQGIASHTSQMSIFLPCADKKLAKPQFQHPLERKNVSFK